MAFLGDDEAAQKLARLQRQSVEKDAIISTQRNAAEDLQRRAWTCSRRPTDRSGLAEAKRCVDDATAKARSPSIRSPSDLRSCKSRPTVRRRRRSC